MSLRYNTADNASGRLQNWINASVTTIPLVSYTNLPATNFIATLVQYNLDGTVNKFEKIYVSTFTGGVITCTRWFDGSAPQTFNWQDYIFLNVVSEIIKDIHLRIDEIYTELKWYTDDIYASWDRRLRVYRLTWDPALQVRIGAGNYRVGTAEWQYAGGTVTVWATATTYIMINSAGVIQTSTSWWNGQYAKLWVVTSSAWAITAISLWKNDVVWWELSTAGFGNITSTTYTNWLLTAFTADGVNFTLTYAKLGLFERW